MIYAGQEGCDNNKPSLFDIDKVNWKGKDISPLITKCASIVKHKIFAYGYYDIKLYDKDIYFGEYTHDSKKVIGIFNLGKETGFIEVNIPDGTHINKLTGKEVRILDSKLELSLEPIILWV